MRLASIEPSVWRPAATAFRERILGFVRGSVNAKGHLTQHDPVLDGNSNPGRLGVVQCTQQNHCKVSGSIAKRGADMPPPVCSQNHPIFNFIFQYYFIQKRILLRWTPGPGVLVRRAEPAEPMLWQGIGWRAHHDGGHYDARQLLGKPGRVQGLRHVCELLRRTAERAPCAAGLRTPDRPRYSLDCSAPHACGPRRGTGTSTALECTSGRCSTSQTVHRRRTAAAPPPHAAARAAASAATCAAARATCGAVPAPSTRVAWWAGAPAPPRHQPLPLRLAQPDLNRAVAASPIACTHFDAYRFFAPGVSSPPLEQPGRGCLAGTRRKSSGHTGLRDARPCDAPCDARRAATPAPTRRDAPHRANPVQAVALNTARLTREEQAAHEQPGCVHASMDLFKYAAKLHPYLPSSLLADTLELAIAARVLDMRASPYDLTGVDAPGFDLRAVRVETPEGRREYQVQQAAVARRAAPLRQQLLRHYDAALEAVAETAPE